MVIAGTYTCTSVRYPVLEGFIIHLGNLQEIHLSFSINGKITAVWAGSVLQSELFQDSLESPNIFLCGLSYRPNKPDASL